MSDSQSRTLIPFAHMVLIDASCLNPYAIRPLNGGMSSWDRVLTLAPNLPHQNADSILSVVCLLPPLSEFEGAVLDSNLALKLSPEALKRRGFGVVHLEHRSEAGLLQAVKRAIESVYPAVFRPDPLLRSLEKLSDPPVSESLPEDVGLPLALRFPEDALEVSLLSDRESLTSRQVHCYLLRGDTPFLSEEICVELYRNHLDFAAELTYADAYPEGIAPILFQANIVPRLWTLRSALPLTGNGLFRIAERDWNRFSVEPLIAPKDYRLMRLDLAAATRRQWKVLERIGTEIRKGTPLLRVIDEKPTWLRSLPSYLPIQITGACPQACSYCPYPGTPQFRRAERTSGLGPAGKMDRALWREILKAVVSFCDDATINLSPFGEPMLHPEFVPFLEDLWNFGSLKVVLETSGVSWTREQIEAVLALNRLEPKLTWILSLDALDETVYRSLRGEGQPRAYELAELLLTHEQSLPERVYLQAVRMRENDGDIEAFYRHWEGRAQVFVQKYNPYSGLLPDRQPLSLAPLERFPCRRLARELVIGLDGRVYSCVQELGWGLSGKGTPLGRFPDSDLPSLWEAASSLYEEQIEGRYPGVCAGCDEYYVYND